MSTSVRLILFRQIHADMVAQAKAECPNECCGLLAGTILKDGENRILRAIRRYPLTNAAASPRKYEASPRELLAAFRHMREVGLDHVAIYHSHPASPPLPSRTDLREWWYGEEVLCLILSLLEEPPVLRAWQLKESSFEQVSVHFDETEA